MSQAGLLSTACLSDGLGHAVNRFDPANLHPQAICVLLIHRRLFDRLDHEGLASSRVRTRDLNNCSHTTKSIDRVSHPSTMNSETERPRSLLHHQLPPRNHTFPRPGLNDPLKPLAPQPSDAAFGLPPSPTFGDSSCNHSDQF